MVGGEKEVESDSFWLEHGEKPRGAQTVVDPSKGTGWLTAAIRQEKRDFPLGGHGVFPPEKTVKTAAISQCHRRCKRKAMPDPPPKPPSDRPVKIENNYFGKKSRCKEEEPTDFW